MYISKGKQMGNGGKQQIGKINYPQQQLLLGKILHFGHRWSYLGKKSPLNISGKDGPTQVKIDKEAKKEQVK